MSNSSKRQLGKLIMASAVTIRSTPRDIYEAAELDISSVLKDVLASECEREGLRMPSKANMPELLELLREHFASAAAAAAAPRPRGIVPAPAAGAAHSRRPRAVEAIQNVTLAWLSHHTCTTCPAGSA